MPNMIVSNLAEGALTSEHVFNAKQGLFLAAALSGFDEAPTVDPSYGSLVFSLMKWGVEAGTGEYRFE